MDSPPVKEYWPIEKLRNWEQNPRTISEKNFERLKAQIKECEVCGTTFSPYRSTSKYCCRKCNYKARNSRQTRREYMASYMRGYYQTEVGKEKVRAKNKKWLESPRGRVFRKNDKARRRGAEGSFTSDYWQWLIGRTQGYCFGCGKRFDIVEIEPDHILPISRGGKNVDWNIQPLCQSCNRHKSKQLMFMDNYIIDMLYAEYLLCRR